MNKKIELTTRNVPRVAILWRNYGPYHYARLRHTRRSLRGFFRIYGIEVSNSSKNYSWEVSRKIHVDFNSLFPGEKDAEVSNIKFCLKFSYWIYVNRIDVLFVPSFWPAYSLVALICAKILGVPVVIMTDSTLKTGKNQGVLFLIKKMLISAYSAAFVSGSWSAHYLQTLGVPSRRIEYGYDVVDNEYFRNRVRSLRGNEVSVRIKNRLRGKYILSLGRFVEKKNLLVLLDAYQLAYSRNWTNGNRLLFVGSGSLKSRLLTQAKEAGLRIQFHDDSEPSVGDGIVEFRDFAQLPMVPLYYAFATALFLPSFVEEWGLVVNEAMAAGCPVCVSKSVGCVPDLVRNEETGMVFEANDTETLAELIRLLCNDVERGNTLARNAGDLIRNWGLPRFSESLANLSRKVNCKFDRLRPTV